MERKEGARECGMDGGKEGKGEKKRIWEGKEEWVSKATKCKEPNHKRKKTGDLMLVHVPVFSTGFSSSFFSSSPFSSSAWGTSWIISDLRLPTANADAINMNTHRLLPTLQAFGKTQTCLY